MSYIDKCKMRILISVYLLCIKREILSFIPIYKREFMCLHLFFNFIRDDKTRWIT